MSSLFAYFLSKLVRFGNIEVETADGVKRRFGDGSGPELAVRINDRRTEWRLMADPSMALGEMFMDGRLDLVRGDLYDFVDLGARNLLSGHGPKWIAYLEKCRTFIRGYYQRNDRKSARRNISSHYDLDHRLYDLFLDADRQYSCAYFEYPGQSLEDAQLAKKRHIVAKMLVQDGHSALDIGCGFGGMGLYLAQNAGARVTGVTLSHEQHDIATQRARDAGLVDRAEFRLQDYRDVEGQFDRIVSVGMFEHVGAAAFDEYFWNVNRLLKDDGVMLLHAIGRSTPPGITNPWIQKYIFPGGYIPAVSEVMAAIERQGLFVTDSEILRLHYADTLKVWRERFLSHRDEAKALYDERFCRMWEFYLAGSEFAFRVDGHMIFQLQIAKRQDIVPRTRNYVADREAQLRRREASVPIPLRHAG